MITSVRCKHDDVVLLLLLLLLLRIIYYDCVFVVVGGGGDYVVVVVLIVVKYTTGVLQVARGLCQVTEKSYNITSGLLTVECIVPPELAHADSSEVVWNVGPPFSLLECEMNLMKTQITCSTDIVEGTIVTATAQYFNISNINICIYQCTFNINLPPNCKK